MRCLSDHSLALAVDQHGWDRQVSWIRHNVVVCAEPGMFLKERGPLDTGFEGAVDSAQNDECFAWCVLKVVTVEEGPGGVCCPDMLEDGLKQFRDTKDSGRQVALSQTCWVGHGGASILSADGGMVDG